MDRSSIRKSLHNKFLDNAKLRQLEADERVRKECENEKFNEIYTDFAKAQIAYFKAKHSGEYKAQQQVYEKCEKKLTDYLALSGKDLTFLEPKYSCQKCNDSGICNGKDCECFTRELNSTLSNIREFDTLDFSSSEHTKMKVENIEKIYDLVKLWCENYPETPINNINLLGDTGTGKTCLLKCVADAMLKRRFVVQLVTAFVLNEECRKYHCGAQSRLLEYLTCDILLIDDIGTEPVLNNVTREYFYNILNERESNKKATIISSNLLLADILDRYGSRIYSRLANKVTSLNILFKGTDARTRIN